MKNKNVKVGRWISAAACAVTAVALATPTAGAQVSLGVRIGGPPPPLRYETRPPMPGPGYAWVDGYYEPFQGRYRWHPGYWNQPPYAGAYYVHPHWDHYPDGWRMHEGYWSKEDHDNHYWDNRRGDDHRGNNRDDRHDDRPH